ncbi:sphinganine kinase lcb4 [Tulasnella sp. 330]|nr:sphinganine kinase lcb4 [Tulasnella sp. 330]
MATTIADQVASLSHEDLVPQELVQVDSAPTQTAPGPPRTRFASAWSTMPVLVDGIAAMPRPPTDAVEVLRKWQDSSILRPALSTTTIANQVASLSHEDLVPQELVQVDSAPTQTAPGPPRTRFASAWSTMPVLVDGIAAMPRPPTDVVEVLRKWQDSSILRPALSTTTIADQVASLSHEDLVPQELVQVDSAPTQTAPGPPRTRFASAWSTMPVLIDGIAAMLRFSTDVVEVLRKWRDSSILRPALSTHVNHVLNAEVKDREISISLLALKSGKLSLVHVEAEIPDPEAAQVKQATEWAAGLMQAAYVDVQPRRTFKILVNPMSGKGQAPKIFDKQLRPIFEAARCSIDVTYTTHSGHGKEIAATLPLTYDAIITISGDGLPYEVINGFAERKDARLAFQKVSVVPIPGGSANAFSINILGVKDAFEPVYATLNAIKGKPMQLDLASVTMMNTRQTVYGFLSVAAGLMAELDIGTENMRWIGETRFIIGFLRGFFNLAPRNLRVTIRKPEGDKAQVARSFLNNPPPNCTPASLTGADEHAPVDILRPSFIDEDDAEGNQDWVTFDKGISYVYAGLMPYVARELMEFPVKQACDGFIHLVLQEPETRSTMLKGISRGPRGETFFLESHHYMKTRALRVTPVAPTIKGRDIFAVDGERIPYESFHMEVHTGLLRTFSMHGELLIPDSFKEVAKKRTSPEWVPLKY